MRIGHKLRLALKVGIRNPFELLDRLRALIESQVDRALSKKPQYPVIDMGDLLDSMPDLRLDVDPIRLDDEGIRAMTERVQRESDKIKANAPFTSNHNADFGLARLCYAICRSFNPEVVLETGVAYGVTTAFILKSLQANGSGVLHSIDLPPLAEDADSFVGAVVPPELRERWTLHRGTARRILPSLLPKLGKVDLFIHDSLHTYWNILYELRTVSSYLAPPSVVVVDDIQDTGAFLKWIEEAKPHQWCVVREEAKHSLFGVATFPRRLDAS